MTIKTRISTRTESDLYDKEVRLFHTEIAQPEAEFAFHFIERWGMVSAVPDGEDSAGRMKLRLATPEELVDRAFKVARIAFVRARIDGLMTDLPDLNEVNAEIDAKRAKKREKENC